MPTPPGTRTTTPREEAPLAPSLGQRRLWFLDRLEGASRAYHLPAALRLVGRLDIEVLRRTFLALIERHQSLRLCFPMVDGEPAARELSTYDPLTLTDLRHLAADEQSDQVTVRARDHAERPFDLATGPLLRLELLILGDERHVLLLNIHHIIADGRSTGILLGEWRALYGALSRDDPPGLSPLPIQYTDFARWQQGHFQGEPLQKEMGYWLGALAGAPTRLELPSDSPRAAVQTHRGGRVESRIPAALTARIKSLSRETGCTLFMTLLAAFHALLHRCTGQEDILIGSPVANRTWPNTKRLIGFFVNILVMRSRFRPRLTFFELSQDVRDTTLGAYAHQQLPFDLLVAQLNPGRRRSHAPLVQVAFAMQYNEMGVFHLPELEVEWIAQPPAYSPFELTLHAYEVDGHLVLAWDYAADLFSADTIRRMDQHLSLLLEGVTANPQAVIAALPLLPPEDLWVLRAWNATATHDPRARTVVDLFEAQVARTPDQVAVECGAASLTYRALNERANALAHHLIAHGVQQDTPVGLCIERSLEMAVGLLGILKAGGAYVPLDPNHPVERLRLMLEESGTSLILLQTSLQHGVAFRSTRRIVIDSDWPAIATCPVSNPALRCGPGHLAYVLFTSGSTGRPKGVAMPHGPLVNLITWHLRDPRLGRPARTLQFAPLIFDISFQELFSTWASGGRLCLVDEEGRRDPRVLFEQLRRHRIERLFLPVLVLDQLAQAADTRPLPDLLDVITAGEALRITPAIRRWFLAGHCRLHNHYGPTEAHVVTSHCLSEDAARWPELPPIGRPIANVRIHLLDDHGNLLPPGVAGELCIAGDALARGYINRPELTAERFIELPGGRLGEARDAPLRLYRTGDRARWRPNGELEFLGRLDGQIKLRGGFRIEPGEIEAALRLHASVADAAVILVGEGLYAFLAAYVTADPLAPLPSAQALREHLKPRLPDYMIPTRVTLLERMPLTPNGKLDRMALPTAQRRPSGRDAGYAAPRTPLEASLAEIWQRILRLASPPSIHDSFFDLGGHSLLAVQVVNHIERELGCHVPVRAIFEVATVASLAEWVNNLRWLDSHSGADQEVIEI